MSTPQTIFPSKVYSLRGTRPRRRILLALLLAVICGSACFVAAYTAPPIPDCLSDTSMQARATISGAKPSAPYPLQTAAPYSVALDAGHGGFDSGANCLVDEVKICEATTDALYALLAGDENYIPMRTRPNGKDLSTAQRAENATLAKASLFLSIHANCDKSTGQSHGFECFPTPPGRLYSQQSLTFAKAIADGMQAAGHRLRGENGIRFAYYSGHSKRIVDSTDTKVRSQKSFGVVEKPNCPAVLVEQCFLTNYKDVEQWASPEGCVRAARIYYEAICTYFGTQPTPNVPAA